MVHLQEAILHHVLGRDGIPRKPQDELKEFARMTPNEEFEAALLTLQVFPQELLVRRRIHDHIVTGTIAIVLKSKKWDQPVPHARRRSLTRSVVSQVNPSPT